MTHPVCHKGPPSHTHTHTLTVPTAHLTSRPVTFSPKSVACQMKNLLSFFQAHTPTRKAKVIRIREIRRKGKDWKKRDERGRTEKGKDHFRACVLWGIKLQMTRAMDQFSPPPLWLSSQAEHTTIWLLTTHFDHKTQLISTKSTHTQFVFTFTHILDLAYFLALHWCLFLLVFWALCVSGSIEILILTLTVVGTACWLPQKNNFNLSYKSGLQWGTYIESEWGQSIQLKWYISTNILQDYFF